MATRGGCFLLFLALFVCFLGYAAPGHITDGRSSREVYSLAGGDGGGVERTESLEIRLLERKRRDTEPQDQTTTTTTTSSSASKKHWLYKENTNKKKIYKKPLVTPTTTTTTTPVPPPSTTTTTTTTTTTATTADGVDDGLNGGGDSPDENRTGFIDVVNDSTTTTTTSTTTTTTTTTSTTAAPEEDVEDEEVMGEVEDVEEASVDPVDDMDNVTVYHHRYYQSHTIRGVEEVRPYWVDLDSFEREEVITNEMLSASHRRAATVNLTFEFPFYGHRLKNITIATGGFLFTGDFVHTWLAATQYIAPLMANFDTSMSKNASVKYADNGTSFTVQWNNVPLKDHADAGTFTFQVTLHKNGDIVFTYKEVPIFVTSIVDDQHPVKVGLSDAYIVHRNIFFVRRKTIYEYHKIDMKKKNMIGNWTAILFKALPTCVSMHTCSDCLSQKISFQCQWCDNIAKCSNGLDRNRQEWLHNNCEIHHIERSSLCPPTVAPPPDRYPETFGGDAAVESFTAGPSFTNITREGASNTSSNSPAPLSPPYRYENSPSSSSSSSSSSSLAVGTGVRPEIGKQTQAERDKSGEGGSSVGVVIGVVFLVSLLLGVVGWVTYAYFYPHSTSGQILIKYRPSTWSWRSGEARYTAASIHSIHM